MDDCSLAFTHCWAGRRLKQRVNLHHANEGLNCQSALIRHWCILVSPYDSSLVFASGML